MTVRRIFAVLFIFVLAALAWFTLGASVVHRSGHSGMATSHAVAALWGGRHRQLAPTAWFNRARTLAETTTEQDEKGRKLTRTMQREVVEAVPIPVISSRATVDLSLAHRRKGLLWHDTYLVDFRARYRLVTPADVQGPVYFAFSFPSSQTIYDDFVFRVNDVTAPPAENLTEGLTTSAVLRPGAEALIEAAYRSRGLDTWHYLFSPSGIATVRDFALTMTTDFEAIDFPVDTLSPTTKARVGDGWRLDWRFDNLVSAKAVGMDLPNRLNPGPLAARITFFAPVSLLFFITVLIMLGVLGHLDLHPMHYFFLSAAFFAFHLLLAYLVDHLDIHTSFVLASATSVGLVVSYLRLVCGFRRALLYAGGSQLVFLVLFSYAFFFSGYTGLTVTVGGVLTLFLLMQLTGKLDCEALFSPRISHTKPAGSRTIA